MTGLWALSALLGLVTGVVFGLVLDPSENRWWRFAVVCGVTVMVTTIVIGVTA